MLVMIPVVIAMETFWQVVRKWYEGFSKSSETLVLVGGIEPPTSSLPKRDYTIVIFTHHQKHKHYQAVIGCVL